MSKAEILDGISRLKPHERDEIRRKLDELDADEWNDAEDRLTPEELALIDKRLAEHEADPKSAIPWEKFRTQLAEKVGG
jgi:putative addiction module component (TIGR02574 family)